MEKQKKWQLYLIIAVIALTIYNILPTVFFYSKPLKTAVDAKASSAIATQILERVDDLEPQSKQWIASFCTLIKAKPLDISISPEQPQFISVTFKNAEDAQTFRKLLPRAGSLVPFAPAQLSIYDPSDTASKSVLVQRRIPIHFNTEQLGNYTQFSQKFDQQNNPTPLYRALIEDRAMQIGMA